MENQAQIADKAAEKQQKKVPGRPFKKGQSGNPSGRPPGTFSLTTILKNTLQEIAENDPQKRKYADIIMRRFIINKGVNEVDTRAIEVMFNRTDGPVKEQTDITSGGEPLNLIARDQIAAIAKEVAKKLKEKEVDGGDK